MAVNQTGIAITIKAFLPTGKTVDEQFEALKLMKDAHASGDYSAVLKAAIIDAVKSENKTRRVDEKTAEEPLSFVGDDELAAALKAEDEKDASGLKAAFDAVEPAGPVDEDVPEFLKAGKKK